ncbi:MAG: hypothetical protein M3R08_04540 [Bacteroidota bacterium]|nr:hypothetical protein [Bacteroidota bacterium]
MLRSISRFMELFWLALAIGLGLSAIYIIVVDGWEEGKRWVYFPAIALAMYIFRRITRRKLDSIEELRRQQRGD